jgi:outer membrane protein OmpA-like peptidoglycan-associated protein
MKTLSKLALLTSVAGLGCAATAPSQELVDARRAYEDARLSAAARHTPDRVLEAKQALDRAELAHQDDAGSFEEKNLAYIATRRAELAVVYGSYEADRQGSATAAATYKARQDQLRREQQGELNDTRATLGSVQNSLAGTRAELDKARSETAAALASLEQVAKVKEEARGTVITLDGSVLFVSAKSELLPIAQKKLDDVAKALNDTAPEQTIVVEGHTDSNGSDASNLKLSQDRADSVRAYLVSRGVKSERITAVGKGESTPVASNDTTEGRANNRRVEIIVQPKAAPSSR